MNIFLSSAIPPSQSEPWSDGNKGVLPILQSSRITGDLPSDCFVISRVLPSEEMQSVDSAVPADRVTGHFLGKTYLSAELQCVLCSPRRLGHWTLIVGVLPFCRDEFIVFCSHC